MKEKSPWFWIPSLYFAEGIPYVIIATTFAMVMYKSLGISNAEAAFYTSWLYLPWLIKPFWSPFVDVIKTKRWWVLLTQLLIGAGLGAVAFSIPTSHFFHVSLCLFWLVAFSSATHDISADGFYMLALNEQQQSFFIGIRSTFYRISMIAGQGGLIYLAGKLQEATGDVPFAWSTTLYISAGLFIYFFLYHSLVLPKPATDQPRNDKNMPKAFFSSFHRFFQKKNIAFSIAFILLYRLGEAQLSKLSSVFLMDDISQGGLGFSTADIGIIYGTVGMLALTFGGILGGVVASKTGLKKSLWSMVLTMNLPNLVYVYMAYTQPSNFYAVSAFVALEQFGYGYGFTAFMLYLIYVSKGEYQTSHYAICTGFMALGMMLPGMAAGWIQEAIGYADFFVWVCFCTLPGIAMTAFLNIDEDFGKKDDRVS